MTYVSIEIYGEKVNTDEDFESLTVHGPGERFHCTHCGSGWDGDEISREDAVDEECSELDEGNHNVEDDAFSWLNHAGVHFDESEDSVTVSISVGDPRGAFSFTVRRTPDGKLIMHTPYPGERLPHVETRELHPGTLAIGH